jgi:predicted membrane chloride channel (bestrophin family)
MKILWLMLSSFGIMYAILSWSQEFGMVLQHKGFIALALGLALYLVVARNVGERERE